MPATQKTSPARAVRIFRTFVLAPLLMSAVLLIPFFAASCTRTVTLTGAVCTPKMAARTAEQFSFTLSHFCPFVLKGTCVRIEITGRGVPEKAVVSCRLTPEKFARCRAENPHFQPAIFPPSDTELAALIPVTRAEPGAVCLSYYIGRDCLLYLPEKQMMYYAFLHRD